MNLETVLPAELAEIEAEVIGYARAEGLDFPEVRFVLLDFDQINQVAAYDGFPARYPHWRFGMEYERMRKSYAYGLHRIYEMVINTEPCYAYLLASNLTIDQKLVMAHVYGHADFFKNNLWFAHTNRHMLDDMANARTRVQRSMDKQGVEEVEDFIDACLSLENLIDIHSPGVRRLPTHPVDPLDEPAEQAPGRMPSKAYMDAYINPPAFLAAQKQKEAEEQRTVRNQTSGPQRDVLLFLLENAPLEAWQQDVLGMVREDAYYFAPQRQTKIMNEGWATYWHSHIMTRHALKDHELIDYADHHSGTVATSPGRLNPYKLGLELLRDIEDRWNRGAFGPEYEECTDLRARANWDKQLGLGRQKLFEVRRIYNDVGLIDEFLTEEFAMRNELFAYKYNKQGNYYEISSRSFGDIKRLLLFQLTNFGQPIIEVVESNYQNRGELYLVHRWEESELRLDYAQATLERLQHLWNRPVHLETSIEEKGQLLFSFDGAQHATRLMSRAASLAR